MPAPDNWYDIVKDFQTVIGTTVGFAGVCVTLITNYRLTNRKRIDDIASERASTRTALISELEAVSGSIKRSKTVFDTIAARGAIAFPRAYNAECQSRAYRAILPKIGLLSEMEIENVVIAYGGYEDLGKMSEETKGEAQDRLTEDQKLIAFNAYVKALSETNDAIRNAIDVLIDKRSSERVKRSASIFNLTRYFL